MELLTRNRPTVQVDVKPRIGCVGVGWIGRHRMEAMVRQARVEVVALVEPAPSMLEAARSVVPDAETYPTMEALLESNLDGVVIATPSAQHAAQSIAALEAGLAVFCQKPLGRNALETARVVRSAEKADRLLGVDLSYRYLNGARQVRELIHQGEIGDVFAVDLVFHNAYGPDKPWFYDPALSGGGCVIDLGIHLVDLALWTLGFPDVEKVTSRLFSGGKPMPRDRSVVEDYANARIDLVSGACIDLACSWNLQAGRDAVIEATFFGTNGGLSIRNVNGSFYDFTTERFHKTSRAEICGYPEDWGGRAAIHWAERLAADPRFDPAAYESVRVAGVLDAIYQQS